MLDKKSLPTIPTQLLLLLLLLLLPLPPPPLLLLLLMLLIRYQYSSAYNTTATTTHLETSSSPNLSPTTILPAEQQQMAAAAAAAAQMAQRPPGANNFVYGPNNPNSGFYPLGASSSSGLPPNSAPLPTGLQGFGRPVAPGPMLTPPIQGLGQGQQPQPGRQQMMVGATHSQMPGLHMLGRPVMHQVASPSPSQVLGRPMSPFPTVPGQGLGRQSPLPLPSGMSRPVPGGIPDGVPQ